MITNVSSKESSYNAVDIFEKESAWGMETLINLYGCDLDTIKDEATIRRYIVELCELIDMKRYGEPMIGRFGEGKLYGYSVIQLIYTSSIVAHFSEYDGRVFIDIFSCKKFLPKVAAEFSSEFFEAKNMEYTTLIRN